MIPGTRLFGRYYFLTALIVLIFIFVGFLASRLVLTYTASSLENRHAIFYARLIDHVNSSNRVEALREIAQWNGGGFPLHLAIVDENGNVVYPAGEKLNVDWNTIAKPTEPYQYEPRTSVVGGAGVSSTRALVRFSGNPVQYLYVLSEHGAGTVMLGRLSGAFVSTFELLVVSVLLGIAFAMTVVFRSLREKAQLADSVLAELQGGNLKARFPITKMDEIGKAMSRFNRMADEIERLVEQLKNVEKSRMALLQELAHDLRTPVASLKNLMETLQRRGLSVDARLRDELFSLALKEVEYFERLVEDLLVLAQVGEPRYRAGQESVCLNDLLDEESENVATQFASSGNRIALRKTLPRERISVRGDVHLLRRMIRNGLDNAFSFARSEVAVQLSQDRAGRAVLTIEDDGSGFSPESLSSFGERRVTRVLGATVTREGGANSAAGDKRPERLSVGLGSVILKTVASVHGGAVQVRNRSGGTTGAWLEIVLPTAAG